MDMIFTIRKMLSSISKLNFKLTQYRLFMHKVNGDTSLWFIVLAILIVQKAYWFALIISDTGVLLICYVMLFYDMLLYLNHNEINNIRIWRSLNNHWISSHLELHVFLEITKILKIFCLVSFLLLLFGSLGYYEIRFVCFHKL